MTLKRAWVVGAAVGVVVVVLFVALYMDFPTSRKASQEAEIHVQRGIQLYQQGAFPEAQVELRSAMEINPDEWRARYYMGVIKIYLKQYDLAIPYLEQALSLNPTESKVTYALGVTYFKLGRLDMAKGYFTASVELDPANADAKSLLETMAKVQRHTELAAAENVD